MAMTHVLGQLLVALDGSDTADRALSYALGLARRQRSELMLCCAVDSASALAQCSTPLGGGNFAPLMQVLEDAATSTLAQATRRVADAGLSASTTVLNGPAAEAIVAYAHKSRAGAIVMGTRGKRGLDRFFLGSTAEGVLRRTDVPVFVVPSDARVAHPEFDRILVAIDDSDPSDAAATFALAFAAPSTAHLILCGVAESTELFDKAMTYGYDPAALLKEMRTAAAAIVAGQAGRAREDAIACESVITDGEPAEQILKVAGEQHADLIVVGTHGRRGVRRLFIGSVAENVVRRSPVPIVVIRASTYGVVQRPGKTVATALH